MRSRIIKIGAIAVPLLLVIGFLIAMFGQNLLPACTIKAANSLYDTQVLGDTPVVYYPLSESRSACDHAPGDAPAGEFFGSPFSTSMPNGDPALKFDGRSSVGIVDDDRFSVASGGAITIEFWMQPEALDFTTNPAGYIYVLGKGKNDQHEYALRFYPSRSTDRPNRISGYAFNKDGGLGIGSYFQDSLRARQWIHVVVVINTIASSEYPTGYTKIYRDGVLRDQDSLTNAKENLVIRPQNGIAPFRIGSRENTGDFFFGSVGKVALYHRELQLSTIQAHYQLMTTQAP